MQKFEIHIPESDLERLSFLHEEKTAIIAYQPIHSSDQGLIKVEVFMDRAPEWLILKLDDISEIVSFSRFPSTSDSLHGPYKDEKDDIKSIKTEHQAVTLSFTANSTNKVKCVITSPPLPFFTYKVIGVLAIKGIYPIEGNIQTSKENIKGTFILHRFEDQVLRQLKQNLEQELAEPAKNGSIIQILSQSNTELATTTVSLEKENNQKGLRIHSEKAGLFTRFALQRCLLNCDLSLQQASFVGHKEKFNDFFVVRDKHGNIPDQNIITQLQHIIDGGSND